MATLKTYVIQSSKLQINGDTYDEVMFDNGVKQECPLLLVLFSLHIDELETYLDEIDGDSSCLFNMVVTIVLYVDGVVGYPNQEHPNMNCTWANYWHHHNARLLLLITPQIIDLP